MIISKEKLIERCKKGDRKSQMQLYSLFYKRVYNSCFRILQDPFESEDAMQDSFIKVFNNLDKYNPETPLEAWIVRIAINTSIDKLREKKLEFVDLNEDQNYLEQEGEEDDWDWIVYQVDAIKKGIESLPDKYRLILTLNLVEGLDFEEIGNLLKMKEGTVRVRFMRGKEKLKTLLSA